jgi:Spy/CpxP family protein refolding chaperone
MRVLRVLLAVVMAFVVVGSLWAAEGKADGQAKGKKGHKPAFAEVVSEKMLKDVTLTADQKTKIDALKTEYEPKVKDAFKKMDVLTPEQKKARNEAVKAAKAAGKPRPEVWKEAEKVVKLTDDQKTKRDAAAKEMKSLRKEISGKVLAVLTPEQQAQVKKNQESRKGHKS